jgi:hypothetical protein
MGQIARYEPHLDVGANPVTVLDADIVAPVVLENHVVERATRFEYGVDVVRVVVREGQTKDAEAFL